jgi:penicillin-binding protein 2
VIGRPRFSRLVALSIIILILISACEQDSDGLDVDLFGSQPTQLDSQSAQQIASTFLDAWKERDYSTMYALISPNARDAFSQDRFVSIYEEVDELLQIQDLTWKDNGVLVQGTTAVVDYEVTFDTGLMGEFTDPSELDEERLMRLIATSEGWRIAWSRVDIFSGWTNRSSLERERVVPQRGNIYDRNGDVLVAQNGTSVQVIVAQSQMPSFGDCVATLARILRRETSDIEADFANVTIDHRLLIGEISQETANRENAALSQNCNADTAPRTTRQYYDRVAPHLIGYVGQIPAERQADYDAEGYPPNALVGLEGVEQAFENELAGVIGVNLVIRSNTGNPIRTVAARQAEPGESVYLTIDRQLQLDVQQTLAEAYDRSTLTWSNNSLGAAAVVMDVNTGEILAMASYPDYDPSIFNPDTPVFDPTTQIAEYKNDLRRPLLNRATQARLPLGSVFKVFSLAAGLDSGVWTPERTVNCTGVWNGEQYGDRSRTDWYPQGHGIRNAHLGLVSSCNPFFWTLGVTLNQADPYLLPEYAREFGFDTSPPLQGVPTDAGYIFDPDRKLSERGTEWTVGDAANMVIGQDIVGVNPLQVARAISAVANGGTLYRPLVVQRVQLIGQDPSEVFEPTGEQIDVSPDVLAQIRDAMCDVTTDPTNGTAEFIFGEWFDRVAALGESISVCGKTGTAESGQTQPHAWFAAFNPAENPQIAVIVVVENSCEGSEVAAPITRRILEKYYNVEPWGDQWDPPLWSSGCTQIGPGASLP